MFRWWRAKEPGRKHLECPKRDMWDNIWKEGKRERETWWWNHTVQQRLREKKVAYKRWQPTGAEEDRETFKDRKRVARREVAREKSEAWAEWSRNLNTAEGRGKMFRIAKQMRKDKRDVIGFFL